MPITAFMGVRISWLMLARNSLFSRLASSALSRASLSSPNMSGVLPPCLVSLVAVLIITGTGTKGPTSTASPCSSAGRSPSRSSLKDSDAACIVL